MTTITPPPAPPSDQSSGPSTPPTPSSPRRNGAAKPVAIVTIAVGAVLLLGAAASAVASTVVGSSTGAQTLTADADGLTALRIDASEGAVSVVFDDVDEAVLDVSGRLAGPWTLKREGDILKVDSPQGVLQWTWGDGARATLTLPTELETAGLDADLSLSSGSLTTDAQFGDVTIEVGAGTLRLDGSAESLELELDAGRADIDLADVANASIDISAGTVVASLTGDAPRSVDIDVSAGSLDLTLPDESYDVREDVSAGSVDNRLQTSSQSPRAVEVAVSAGSVALRSGR